MKLIVKVIKTFVSYVSTVLIVMSITIVTVLMLESDRSSKGVSVFGYSPLYIKTHSMESVMPAGSLILIREDTDSNYQVGDDITFLNEYKEGMVVTHRIIEIIDDHENNGKAFRTQGVDNPYPDEFPVFQKNVMGKVILIVPMLGVLLSYMQENILLFIVIGVILILFISYLTKYLKLCLENYKDKGHKLEKGNQDGR